MADKSLIDVHVHAAAFPDRANGCFMSGAFQSGTLVKLVRWKLGLTGETPEAVNRCYVDRLLAHLRVSQRVGRAVLLALDGVYDEAGAFDERRTHMRIGNDYVAGVVAAHPAELLFGASVNPRRRDAIDELHRVIENGARLVKVLPNSQDFDPMDRRFVPFFRVLAEKKIPLLSHVGYEFSVTAGTQAYGRPERLALALDEGATVIAAHAGGSGVFAQGTFFETFRALIARYPNLYADLSAVTLPNRARVVYQLRRLPELAPKLLFGSDYPLSAYATPFLGSLAPAVQWSLWRTKNIFDKQAGILDAMGVRFDPSVAERLLNV